MKTVIICCLMTLVCLNAIGQKPIINLQGAWKLFVSKEIANGKIVNAFSDHSTFNETKIWSGNHVMFANHYKGRNEETRDFGVGTWKLNGNNYEEYFTISSYTKGLENKTAWLKLEMNGDTLVQTFFLNEKFEPAEDTTYIFKYIKLN